MSATDWQADWREAQAAGHHRDCDGWRTAHRVEIERTEAGTFRGVCADCGPLYVGSSSARKTAESLSAGHSYEERCDLRCREWEDVSPKGGA